MFARGLLGLPRAMPTPVPVEQSRESMKPFGQIVAVIVAYRPDLPRLTTVLNAAAAQTDDVLIVANDGALWSCPLPTNATMLKQDKNLGLGAAYNRAADWARERGGRHLLLLDQDSVAAPGMVAALLQAFTQPGPVAAGGPFWRDSRTGEDGFFLRHARWGTRRYKPAAGEIVAVDFLISSGSLISLDALTDIGPFDEKLFIEHVDTDWTLRARAKGYRLYGVADARLDHAFGEATLTALPFGRRRLFLYPPERNYYLLRNSIALWHRPYVPWPWVLRDFCRVVVLMLFYVLIVPPRFQRLRAMFRAVRDGAHLG
jgi:rhamnosyltransferase